MPIYFCITNDCILSGNKMKYYIGLFKRIQLEVRKEGKVIYDGPAEEVREHIEDEYYSKVLSITTNKIVVEI